MTEGRGEKPTTLTPVVSPTSSITTWSWRLKALTPISPGGSRSLRKLSDVGSWRVRTLSFATASPLFVTFTDLTEPSQSPVTSRTE